MFWVGDVFYRPVPCNFEAIMMAVSGLIFAGMTLGNNSQVSPDVGAARVSATHIFRLLDRETQMDTDNVGDPVLTHKGSFRITDVKFEYPCRQDVPSSEVRASRCSQVPHWHYQESRASENLPLCH